MSTPAPGTLYLLPVGLASPGEDAPTWNDWLPLACQQIASTLQHFIAENAKTARASLKGMAHPSPLRELSIQEIPRELNDDALDRLLAPLATGASIGLMSEAGCPAVADPGALLVRHAHQQGYPVRPLIGPSSLLLALMASGLNGQRFAFHGYLPSEANARTQAIAALEKESAKFQQTQLFIETPYRNQALCHALLNQCRPQTQLCIASDISLPSESIFTACISEWRKRPAPQLDRRPTVFLLLSGG